MNNICDAKKSEVSRIGEIFNSVFPFFIKLIYFNDDNSNIR